MSLLSLHIYFCLFATTVQYLHVPLLLLRHHRSIFAYPLLSLRFHCSITACFTTALPPSPSPSPAPNSHPYPPSSTSLLHHSALSFFVPASHRSSPPLPALPQPRHFNLLVASFLRFTSLIYLAEKRVNFTRRLDIIKVEICRAYCEGKK